MNFQIVSGRKGRRFFLLAIPLVVPACTPSLPMRGLESLHTSLVTSRDPMMSVEEIRRLQTRDAAVPRNTAFAAAINTLQDMGYRIRAADVVTGLVLASRASKDSLRLNLGGLSTARQISQASIYLETFPAGGSRVRAQFHVDTVVNSDPSRTSETSIRENGVYHEFFARLEEELRTRLSTDTVIPPPGLEGSVPPQNGVDLNTAESDHVADAKPGSVGLGDPGEAAERPLSPGLPEPAPSGASGRV